MSVSGKNNGDKYRVKITVLIWLQKNSWNYNRNFVEEFLDTGRGSFSKI